MLSEINSTKCLYYSKYFDNTVYEQIQCYTVHKDKNLKVVLEFIIYVYLWIIILIFLFLCIRYIAKFFD